jgi:hypothetical protein
MQYAPQPLPNQALCLHYEPHESHSGVRGCVRSPAPATTPPELLEGRV